MKSIINEIQPLPQDKEIINSKNTIAAEMTFDAAHRLSNYEGKCKRIHGHTYRVIVQVSSKRLNQWGAVLDFGDLKKLMNIYIDNKYDHKLILYINDPINIKIADSLPDKDWITWMTKNTSAENIAQEIYTEIRFGLKKISKNITLDKVTVYETPKNLASYQEYE